MTSVTGAADAPRATSIFSARTSKASNGKDPSELGKDEFMKLLMAQLQHQDPMKPMDDQAFIAQIAQFNSLDQLTALNTAIGSLLQAQQLTEASGMIGKVVTALDADGKNVTGAVTAAGVEDGKAMLHIGATKVRLDKVTAVAADAASMPAAEPAKAPKAPAAPGA
ncbi:MAG TPA: flagellar hook capping FlgD N-terminal domain-containing protein [Chloroflexota bacterium]|jgi:flagellar basal-body rod modification protein FlgD|nr:flagellar hook capping FlgD N-terminal domain-containing protein [Chloroflexota bacterium]